MWVLSEFLILSVPQFSHTEKGMAVNFLLHTALRNQCFTFVFYWNPFDFQNSPQDCLQGRGQTPQHRGSSKSDPTRTFQLRLSLLPLHTALEQNPSCLAPNMLKKGDDEVHSVWVFFPSLVNRKNWGWGRDPLFERFSKILEWLSCLGKGKEIECI